MVSKIVNKIGFFSQAQVCTQSCTKLHSRNLGYNFEGNHESNFEDDYLCRIIENGQSQPANFPGDFVNFLPETLDHPTFLWFTVVVNETERQQGGPTNERGSHHDGTHIRRG